MLRCDKSAGRYRVTFHILHHSEPFHVQVMGHHDINIEIDGRPVHEEAAWVGNEKPFEGELCEHELEWLVNGIPGRDYRLDYDFAVEKLI